LKRSTETTFRNRRMAGKNKPVQIARYGSETIDLINQSRRRGGGALVGLSPKQSSKPPKLKRETRY